MMHNSALGVAGANMRQVIKATRPSAAVKKSGSKGDHVQSLVRALTIINRLADAEDGISVAQQRSLSAARF